MDRKRVGIVLFEDVEVLDFCGPFEVFSATRVNEEKRREEPSPFEVLLIAERPGPLTTTGGMKVLPHYTFDNCPHLDIVVSPGGLGTWNELKNPSMLEWLRARAAEAETVTAVCTGSMLLGVVGLLDGRHATTHWRALDWMRDSFPSVTVELRQALREGWPRVYVCRNLRWHRHGAHGRGGLPRRGDRKGDGAAHGIPLPRKRCAPN